MDKVTLEKLNVALDKTVKSLAAEAATLRQQLAEAERAWSTFLPVSERLYRTIIALPHPLGQELAQAVDEYYKAVSEAHAALAAAGRTEGTT